MKSMMIDGVKFLALDRYSEQFEITAVDVADVLAEFDVKPSEVKLIPGMAALKESCTVIAPCISIFLPESWWSCNTLE